MYTLGVWIYMLMIVALPTLLLLYTVGIQYEAGGICRVLVVFVLLGWLLDVLLNYTALRAYTGDKPRAGEYTFSQRLARLITRGGRIGTLCLWLALALNALCPSQKHVHLPT